MTLRELLPLLRRETDRSFLEHAQERTAACRQALQRQAESKDTPMKPQVVVHHMGRLLPDRAILTADAGSVTMWGARVHLRRGMSYSFSGTHCTMGSALSYAIGAKFACPDRPVVAFMGDGALAMGMGELATLAQYELPITVVVMHNGSLALEVWEQNAMLGNPQYGCELSSIDFAGVARACGLRGYHVDDPSDVADVLAEALGHDGPALVNCVVDPYEPPFGETLKPTHAENVAAAFERGEPARQRMAAGLLDPVHAEISPCVQQAREKLSRYT